MIPFEKIKTLFFDYDGTLHNGLLLYAKAFRKTYDFLVQEGYAEPRVYSDQEISYWLGFSPPEMWKAFMPDLDEDLRQRCSNMIEEEMRKEAQYTKPTLYEGALEILRYLKEKGYYLIFISNCKKEYKAYHMQTFDLEQYFDEMVCSEEYDFIPKYEILRQIKDKYPKESIIIGDRRQDLEAGKKNDIYTIGCTYGFALDGELEGADFLIDDINVLRTYL